MSKLTRDLTVSLIDRTFQHRMETPNSHEGWDEVLAWRTRVYDKLQIFVTLDKTKAMNKDKAQKILETTLAKWEAVD